MSLLCRTPLVRATYDFLLHVDIFYHLFVKAEREIMEWIFFGFWGGNMFWTIIKYLTCMLFDTHEMLCINAPHFDILQTIIHWRCCRDFTSLHNMGQQQLMALEYYKTHIKPTSSVRAEHGSPSLLELWFQLIYWCQMYVIKSVLIFLP